MGYGLCVRYRHDRGRSVKWVSRVDGCIRRRSYIVGESYGVVSFEGESSEQEVDGMLVCLMISNDIPYHVRYINHRNREEHVSRQGQNFLLMLYGVGGEGD